jgi:hypothetical protein
MSDAARSLRARVDRAGGRLEISVRTVRDAFGLSRLTATGRSRIASDLRAAGVGVDSRFAGAALDDVIVLTSGVAVPPPPPPAPPAPPGHGPDPRSGQRPAGGPSRPAPRHRPPRLDPPAPGTGVRAARTRSRGHRVVLAIALGLAGLILLGMFGALVGSGDDTSAGGGLTAPAATESTTARPDPVTEATRLLALAERAVTQDRPAVAERYLALIPAEAEDGDTGVGPKVARARVLVERTRRYLTATRAAGSGRHAVAARTMRSLGNFRDAPAKDRIYSREVARVLVAQARADIRNDRPAEALARLERAERWFALPAIPSMRSEAEALRAELARPPAPEPAKSPGSGCDPNYAGACLDPSSSDYDCAGGSGNGPDYTGPVRVVGVDRFGLDRDGNGYGCE